MKFIKWMQKNFLKQETLYWWFLFTILLPSIVLSVTEPYSLWVSIASVFIPLGVYALLFNIFRKPGYFYLLNFILLFVHGYQLVLIYLYSESVISPDMFLNLATTDTGESKELMGTLWPAVLIAIIVYYTSAGLAFYSVKSKEKLSAAFIKRTSWLALIPIWLGLGALFINSKRGFEFDRVNDIYPVNAIYNAKYAAVKYYNTKNHHQTSYDFCFNATKSEQLNKKEVIVLVIGETSRAANFQLYGYERATNPMLSQIDDLIVYKDVLTQANVTHKIVPMILSAACAENFNCIYNQKSIITAFKESGFSTYFISNQVQDRAFIDSFASEADSLVRLYDGTSEFHPNDMAMIPIMKEIISGNDNNMFFVLHTYGSHFSYNQRYDKEDAVYKPDFIKSLTYKEREQIVNAYDNTILNVDKTIYSIINELNDSTLCSSMLYLSDHGEDLIDDERRMFLHCSPIPTYYQLHVPFILWFSDNYKRNYPTQYKSGMPT